MTTSVRFTPIMLPIAPSTKDDCGIDPELAGHEHNGKSMIVTAKPRRPLTPHLMLARTNENAKNAKKDESKKLPDATPKETPRPFRERVQVYYTFRTIQPVFLKEGIRLMGPGEMDKIRETAATSVV